MTRSGRTHLFPVVMLLLGMALGGLLQSGILARSSANFFAALLPATQHPTSPFTSIPTSVNTGFAPNDQNAPDIARPSPLFMRLDPIPASDAVHLISPKIPDLSPSADLPDELSANAAAPPLVAPAINPPASAPVSREKWSPVAPASSVPLPVISGEAVGESLTPNPVPSPSAIPSPAKNTAANTNVNGNANGTSTNGMIARVGNSTQADPNPNPKADANAAGARRSATPEDRIYEQLARQYDQFAVINRTFELVARVVSPAVVHLESLKERPVTDTRVTRTVETGSGVIVRDPRSSSHLYILTNAHVVSGAAPSAIKIILHDARVLRPTRVFLDRRTDLALLLLDRTDLPCVRLGNSDEAVVGTWVLAIGSPFGLKQSVSQGIISARGRYEDELHDEGVENQDFLQTDAAINPGNSGGPLVNLKGEVIGINTAIATNHGGSEGVGFSIPINLAKWISDQLLRTGKVKRGGIGVELGDLIAETIALVGLERPRGARILGVHPNSPAAKAGIHQGDIVLRFQQVDVENLNHLINLVSMAPVGNAADIVLWRDHARISTRVMVGDLDEMRQLQLLESAGANTDANGNGNAYAGRIVPRSPAVNGNGNGNVNGSSSGATSSLTPESSVIPKPSSSANTVPAPLRNPPRTNAAPPPTAPAASPAPAPAPAPVRRRPAGPAAGNAPALRSRSGMS